MLRAVLVAKNLEQGIHLLRVSASTAAPTRLRKTLAHSCLSEMYVH